MAVTTELTTLHRTVDELRGVVDAIHVRYGDIPAVRRLVGDLDRIGLDAAELDDATPLRDTVAAGPVHVLDDQPHDPSLWIGADDEGLGGYHR